MLVIFKLKLMKIIKGNNLILYKVGIGDWGLGIGDLGLGGWGTSPNPTPPKPNPTHPPKKQ